MRRSSDLSRHRWFLAVALLGACAVVGCGTNGNASGGTGSGGAGSGASGAGGMAGVGGSPPATGGTTGAAGVSGGGGTTGVAGFSGGGGFGIDGGAAGGSGSGGGGMGGSTGGSAAAGAGGTSVGGEGGTSIGGQGGGAAGAGGSAAAGGAAGAPTKAPAVPSKGCGQATPETGTFDSPLTVSNHKYYVKLPTTYDPNKPYPALFVFNGTGDPIRWAEINTGYETRAGGAIRVYPHPASSAGWGAGDVSFFMPLYEQITSSFCVDKARVFAAGSDSGGTFASILGCEYASLLRGVAPSGTREPRAGTPDAAYPLDATMRNCTGRVTAIVIHGLNDVFGPEHGPKTRDFYRTLNGCGTDSEPVRGYTEARSNCVQYLGCYDGRLVYWCQHTDPTYNGTNHGWPGFASGMTWSVFSSY